MLRFTLKGEEHTYDQDKLMFSEAMELQRQAGLSAGKLNDGIVAGDSLALGGMFWVASIRRVCETTGTAFRDAAKANPFADFEFDLMGTMGSLEDLDKANPTQPTPEPTSPGGPPEPAFPDTFAPLSPETTTPISGLNTSDASPSTAESAPGSGTA